MQVDVCPPSTTTWKRLGAGREPAGRQEARRAVHARVGDEVLVAFGDGQFDSPYVVGLPVERRADLAGRQARAPRHRHAGRAPAPLRGQGPRQTGGRRAHHPEVQRRAQHHARGQGPKKLEIKSTAHTILLDDTPGASKISISAGGGAVTINLNTVPPSVSLVDRRGVAVHRRDGVTVTAPVISDDQRARGTSPSTARPRTSPPPPSRSTPPCSA